MRKLVTKDQEINLEISSRIYPEYLPNNTQDIKLVGDQYIDLQNLNLNIVKYDIDNDISRIDIDDCNINKLVLSEDNTRFFIKNSTIQNIYIQSKVMKLELINTNIPNLHGRVDLIDKIKIEQ